MPWFKVDDALYGHPKWLAASPHARALWVSAGSWCSAHLTDGVVPCHVLPTLGGRARDAAELVRVGLWSTVDGGWVFHGWLEMQPSAEQVEADRAAARERQRRARDKARASRRDTTVTDNVSHDEVRPAVTVPPTRPDPTRPSLVTSSAAATTSPDDRKRRLDEAAAVIGERAALRPGVENPAAVARAVARAVVIDRHQDAYAALHGDPTMTAEQLAEHLEPTTTPARLVLPPAHIDETIADLTPPPAPRIAPDAASLGRSAVAALKHRTPEDA